MSNRARHARPSVSARAYARGAAVLGAAAVAAGAGVIGAGAAGAATPVTASTYITNHPDGGHGTPSTWAYDNFTRKLTVTPSSSPATDCPGMPAADICYDATIADSGKFDAIVGAGTPNGTGTQISHAVQGTETGTYALTMYAPPTDVPSASNVPATRNDNFAAPATTTTNWPGLVFANPSDAVISGGAYSWTYTDACDKWTDSSTNNDGQGAADGNITGNTCVTGHTGPGYIVNVNSGKALDVTGGDFAQGTPLQQWTKGAKSPSGVAGGDQQFEIVAESNGNDYLVAVDGSKDYYVTPGAQGYDLVLSTYPTSAAVLDKSGPYYEFPNDGNLVMDVKGASTANGGLVEGWPLHDATNQQWSLP